IQGAILVASLLQIFLGMTGLVGLVLRFIGPLAIAPTINLIGLSLFIEAGKKCGTHWGIAALIMYSMCTLLKVASCRSPGRFDTGLVNPVAVQPGAPLQSSPLSHYYEGEGS
ncbi:hypothetical protein CRUP_022637, partial [Coryphaenoides rupestris]